MQVLQSDKNDKKKKKNHYKIYHMHKKKKAISTMQSTKGAKYNPKYPS